MRTDSRSTSRHRPVASRGSRLPLQWRLVPLVGATAAACAVVVYALGGLSAVERQTVDSRFRIRGVERPSGRIVIVAVDDKMLRRADTVPPIRRIYYAQVVNRLRLAHARLVAIDAQFIGASARPSDDRALLAAMERNRVLVVTPDDARGPPPLPTGADSAPGVVLASAGVDPDPDGKLRQMLYSQVALKTLAVRAAELVTGRRVDVRAFHGDHAWIDFRGPPGTFPTRSMADVLAGRVPASYFAHKIVLIGVTAPVEKEVFLTSASSLPMSGVEVHANALETILNGFPLQSASGTINILLILALSAVPACFGVRLSALWVFGAALVTVAMYLIAAQLAFNSGYILNVVCPLLGLGLSCAGVIAAQALIERRQKEALMATLDALDLVARTDAGYFISYRRDQSSFVARSIKSALEAKVGAARVYLDERSNSPGEEWPQRIEQEIYRCGVMLVVIGPRWLEAADQDNRRRLDDPDDWVRREIEAGLDLPRRQAVVVPILHDGASMPAARDLPDSIKALTNRTGVALSGLDTAAEIETLIASIEDGSLRVALADDVGAATKAAARHGSEAVSHSS